MKFTAFFILALLASVGVSSPVTGNDVRLAAQSLSLSSPIAAGGSVTDVDAVTNSNGDVAYFVVKRSDGSALVMSSDTDRAPLVAVVDNAFDPLGGIVEGPAIWDMVAPSSVTNDDTVVTTNTTPMRRYYGSVGCSSVSGAAGIDGRVEKNNSKWKKLTTRFKTPKLKVAPSSESKIQVIEGFEKNGKYTHWGQSTANYIDGNGNMVMGSKWVYNYYMKSYADGGPQSGGLQRTGGTWPCGCVATALAAATQCIGCSGVIDSPLLTCPVYTDNGSTVLGNYTLLPGSYDWSCLPTNFGGTAQAAYNDSGLTDQARELLGRVTFNCGIGTRMSYGSGSSGTNQQYLLSPCESNNFWAVMSARDGAYYGSWSADKHTAWAGGVYSDEDKIQDLAIDLPRVAIPLGIPVVYGMYQVGQSSGHCVLGVGYYEDEEDGEIWVRLFMGWNGIADSWYRVYPEFDITAGGYRFNRFSDVGVVSKVGFPSIFKEIIITNRYDRITERSVKGIRCSEINPVPASTNMDTTTFSASTVRGTVAMASSKFFVSPSQAFMSHQIEYSEQYSDPHIGSIVITPNDIHGSYECTPISGGFNTTGFGCRWMRYGASFTPTILRMFDITPRLGVVTGFSDTQYLRSNYFMFGTPEPFSRAVDYARTNSVPVVVLSGTNGVEDVVSACARTNGSVSCTYFVDVPTHSQKDEIDTPKSVMVVDPSCNRGGIEWSPSGTRLSYGAYDNPRDVVKTIEEGIEKYENK